jgi:hypothetical protein
VSPVRISARASGSRLRSLREIVVTERSVESLWKKGGAKKRAATVSEVCSLVRLSTERCLGGPSRSCRGEGKRQRRGSGAAAGPPRGIGRGTFRKSDTEQERPSSAARRRSKESAYKAKPKWLGAERESEGLVVPEKAVRSRWREGALLWFACVRG